MKILLSGGAGFIGRYVAEQLLRDDIGVIIFDHHSPGFASVSSKRLKGAEYYIGDIRDEVAVTEAMAHVDGFIHLAGVLGTQETIGNPKPAVMTNIVGGLNMLEAAAQYDISGVNIAVGNHLENNPYSISKSTVERLASMYRKERGVQVSSVRALNAYGPRQSVAAPYGTSRVRKIMPSFIMRALHNHAIEVYGDGAQIMDMIYVEDVADFLVDTLMHTMEHGAFEETIEAGTGRKTTVLEIANTVLSSVGSMSEVKFLPMRPGETPGAIVVADTNIAKRLLYPNGKGLVSLETGVKRTVAYYKGLIH